MNIFICYQYRLAVIFLKLSIKPLLNQPSSSKLLGTPNSYIKNCGFSASTDIVNISAKYLVCKFDYFPTDMCEQKLFKSCKYYIIYRGC